MTNANKLNRVSLPLFLTLAISMILAGETRAQSKVKIASNEIQAAFGFECMTGKFPKIKLRSLISKAQKMVRTEGLPLSPKAVSYDLNGDGIKEYFIALRDMGIGDNYVWGIFSSSPLKFLGIVRAEHIFISKPVRGWSRLIAHWHESTSESSVFYHSYSKGRYSELPVTYKISPNLNNEPEYTAKTTDIYLCDRDF